MTSAKVAVLLVNLDAVVFPGKRANVELVDKEILEGRGAKWLAATGEDGRIDEVALGGAGRALDLLGAGVGAVVGAGNVVHAARVGDDVLVLVVGGNGYLVGGPVARAALLGEVEGVGR